LRTHNQKTPEGFAMPRSYVNLIYHIVFSTKDRQPIITDEYQARLHEYIGGIIRGQGGIALAVGGMPDHIHVLAKLRQDKALSDVLRELKASASG
jgi:REP element-mobilizing transposase RayT